MIVGLTGGIATGKSTVSHMLTEAGYVVIDSDAIARYVVRPTERAYAEIVAHFGTDVLLPDGQLDRKALGRIVFADPVERKVLEKITHPAIFAESERQIAEAQRAGHRIIFLDVPLLIETGRYKTVDKVMLVYTDADTQLQRLIARDGLTPAKAQERIAAQMPIDEKRSYAEIIIDNNGSLEQLEENVQAALIELQKVGI